MYQTNEFSRIGCVIMASGLGKRFGSNKLMADFAGKPLIQWILDSTEDIFGKRIVVTRHEAVVRLCQNQHIDVILHDFSGRNDTIRLGLEAMPASITHCMFCPGDQPLLKKESIESLCRRAASPCPEEVNRIWRLSHGDIVGAPVLFPASYFPALKTLPEGKGGGHLIKQHIEMVRCLEIENPFELMDVDRPETMIELLTYMAK